VNALRLVLDIADQPLAMATINSACDGAFSGVWGADAGEPVALASDTRHLVGQKRFASGLGVVSKVVMTAHDGDSAREIGMGSGAPHRLATRTGTARRPVGKCAEPTLVRLTGHRAIGRFAVISIQKSTVACEGSSCVYLRFYVNAVKLRISDDFGAGRISTTLAL